MAQTGYTPIKLYASSTASAVPLAGNLDNTNGAELAINITDGRLYYKDNGGTVRVIAGTGGTGVVAGSNTQIQFNNSGVFGASSNLTWNGSTLAVTGTTAVTGALTATADSTFSSTGALLISKGTSGQQPRSPVTGMLRYNTTINQFEGYSGSSPAWNPVGGATLSNDTSTATNVFPLFANATSGSATTVFTSNAKLLYRPSTGEFQASILDATNGIFVNSQTIASDYTIAGTDNGGSFGPVTVNSGITVTVSTGATWTVV
jgi:hypothetical protein